MIIRYSQGYTGILWISMDIVGFMFYYYIELEMLIAQPLIAQTVTLVPFPHRERYKPKSNSNDQSRRPDGGKSLILGMHALFDLQNIFASWTHNARPDRLFCTVNLC